MKVIILVMVLVYFGCAKEEDVKSNCQIQGISELDWTTYYSLKHINDSHEGLIASFTTNNITEIKISKESPYLTAKLENSELTISVKEEFKNFEADFKNDLTLMPFEIHLQFTCTEGKPKNLRIQQFVTDINNHDPVFSKDVYQYDFAMAIPKNFEMTVFQTISASDGDFTNKNIFFTMELEETKEFFTVGVQGKTVDRKKHDYFTSLKAAQNITAPFEMEFAIIARDEGNPSRTSKAKVVVRVKNQNAEANSGEEIETAPHPLVFAKHLYFAKYTIDDKIVIDEPIAIIKGDLSENTAIRQSDYANYIKITPNITTKEFEITTLKPLTEEILARKQIVMEIEAENEGLSIPGRTALLIDMPQQQNNAGETGVHPPVFSEHLYFANYTSGNELKMEEVIKIKYGAGDKMIVRQSNYSEYFNVSLKGKDEVQVQTIKPLSQKILKNSLLTMEIEAENEGLSIPGRTALLISTTKYFQNGSNNCTDHVWGYNYSGDVFGLVWFFAAILIIVFLNIIVISVYLIKNNRAN